MINLIVDLLLPPASLAVLALIVIAVGGRKGRIASFVILPLLILLGLPVVATALQNSLEPAPSMQAGLAPQAIVILSADGFRVAPPADLEPGIFTLDRLRSGAALARKTGLPILVSGGRIYPELTSLAEMMGVSLRDDFQLAARWEENRSLDTWQNAEFSAAILKQAGIQRVYLVTHEWHMRRSLIALRHFGLDPVPVPVRAAYMPPFSWRGLMISPVAWLNSYIALHEWVGLAYYALRG